MEINWTVMTYLVVIIFVLVGFSSGWWKEALVTSFLGILVLLLQNPEWAQVVVDFINQALASLWEFIPASWQPQTTEALAVETGGGAPQLDATSSATWLFILVIGLLVVTQIGRLALPGSYAVGIIGRILGAALGGINGLILVNLVREYLDGRSLPGSTAPVSSAGITIVGGSSTGTALSPPAETLAIQATDLPDFTLLDSVGPWVIVGIGLFLLVVALISSVTVERNDEDMRRVSRRRPFGYR